MTVMLPPWPEGGSSACQVIYHLWLGPGMGSPVSLPVYFFFSRVLSSQSGRKFSSTQIGLTLLRTMSMPVMLHVEQPFSGALSPLPICGSSGVSVGCCVQSSLSSLALCMLVVAHGGCPGLLFPWQALRPASQVSFCGLAGQHLAKDPRGSQALLEPFLRAVLTPSSSCLSVSEVQALPGSPFCMGV